jgi:hypothetical protein
MHIVTLAVSKLGGATKAVDVEDIAIEAYDISPDKFSWRKYPERIDLRVVQYALKDASSERKGNPLLQGSVKHGYLLTKVGMEWAESNKNINFGQIRGITRKQSVIDKLSLEKARLLTSIALEKFEAGNFEDIKIADFQEFARVNDYFPKHVRQKRYAVIDNAVQGNTKLEDLWAFLIKRFVEGEP